MVHSLAVYSSHPCWTAVWLQMWQSYICTYNPELGNETSVSTRNELRWLFCVFRTARKPSILSRTHYLNISISQFKLHIICSSWSCDVGTDMNVIVHLLDMVKKTLFGYLAPGLCSSWKLIGLGQFFQTWKGMVSPGQSIVSYFIHGLEDSLDFWSVSNIYTTKCSLEVAGFENQLHMLSCNFKSIASSKDKYTPCAC